MKYAAALLAAVLLLAGCGGSDSDGAAAPTDATGTTEATGAPSEPAPTTPATEPTKDAGVVVDIVVKNGKVTPQGDRVDVTAGQTVTLNVTSDADEEIHVHSDPEHTYEVGAGDSISESFTLDTPGQVAVEAHHLDVTIVQLVVRP